MFPLRTCRWRWSRSRERPVVSRPARATRPEVVTYRPDQRPRLAAEEEVVAGTDPRHRRRTRSVTGPAGQVGGRNVRVRSDPVKADSGQPKRLLRPILAVRVAHTAKSARSMGRTKSRNSELSSSSGGVPPWAASRSSTSRSVESRPGLPAPVRWGGRDADTNKWLGTGRPGGGTPVREFECDECPHAVPEQPERPVRGRPDGIDQGADQRTHAMDRGLVVAAVAAREPDPAHLHLGG